MPAGRQGFTLIELLVVISIIALLSSVVLSSVNSARAKARDARRLSDLHSIRNAFALYASDNNYSYPGALTGYNAVHNNNYNDSGGCNAGNTTSGLRPYIPSVCSMYGPNGLAAGDIYYYVVTNNYNDYRLGAAFELSQNQGAPFLAGDGTPLAGFYEQK